MCKMILVFVQILVFLIEFSFFSVGYNVLSSTLYISAVICVLYCQDSNTVFRLNYVVGSIYIIVALHQIFGRKPKIPFELDSFDRENFEKNVALMKNKLEIEDGDGENNGIEENTQESAEKKEDIAVNSEEDPLSSENDEIITESKGKEDDTEQSEEAKDKHEEIKHRNKSKKNKKHKK